MQRWMPHLIGNFFSVISSILNCYILVQDTKTFLWRNFLDLMKVPVSFHFSGAIMFGDSLLPSECALIVEELKQTSLCFQVICLNAYLTEVWEWNYFVALCAHLLVSNGRGREFMLNSAWIFLFSFFVFEVCSWATNHCPPCQLGGTS